METWTGLPVPAATRRSPAPPTGGGGTSSGGGASLDCGGHGCGVKHARAGHHRCVCAPRGRDGRLLRRRDRRHARARRSTDDRPGAYARPGPEERREDLRWRLQHVRRPCRQDRDVLGPRPEHQPLRRASRRSLRRRGPRQRRRALGRDVASSCTLRRWRSLVSPDRSGASMPRRKQPWCALCSRAAPRSAGARSSGIAAAQRLRELRRSPSAGSTRASWTTPAAWRASARTRRVSSGAPAPRPLLPRWPRRASTARPASQLAETRRAPHDYDGPSRASRAPHLFAN